MSGEENADEMRPRRNGKPKFLSNHAGGILGGISTGQPIVARFVVKPTSSILSPRKRSTSPATRRRSSQRTARSVCRHPCGAGGRAMMALVLADHALRHIGQAGRPA